MKARVLFLHDAAATERAGAAIATALRPGMVITLAGDLGSGKTTLARGLIRALGWAAPVKSPTFALVEHYPFSSLYLYHFDFYRFEQPAEWDDAGIAEAFRNDSVCLVEWPERVASLLPPCDLALRLAPDDASGGRRLEATASTAAGRACLSALEAAIG